MAEVVANSANTGFVSRWILNRPRDIVFFVATPLLILPLCFLASLKFSGEDILLIVSCFGALGHHAPGLMRAYGDRGLFRRYWLRFTLAPAAAFFLFLANPPEQIPGVMLILLCWSVWHFLMQTYGFARIYDARAGVFDPVTQRLDFALCIAWSGTCLLFAPGRMSEYLSLALKSGVTSVLALPFTEIRNIWFIATIVITLLFAVNAFWRALHGDPVNVAKLSLFASTFLFFWFCAVSLTNFLIGIAMFELFHDVQYLAIVWLFNQNRVRNDPQIGSFTHFLFRPGGGRWIVYLGLVLAYGFVAFVAERLSTGRLQQVLFGVVAASNLLHFYYDGFIWKIRDTATSEALDLHAGSRRIMNVSGLKHAAKWCVLILLAAGLLHAQSEDEMSALDQARAVAECVPDSITALNTLAKECYENGDYLECAAAARKALEFGSERHASFMYLGVALNALDQPNQGFEHLQRAFELNPHDAFLRFHLAMGYVRQSDYEQAAEHLRASIRMSPDDAVAHQNLGAVLLMQGRPEEAAGELALAVGLMPDNPPALTSLGDAYLQLGKTQEAIDVLQQSRKIDVGAARTNLLLAHAWRAAGQPDRAVTSLLKVAELLLHRQHAGRPAADLENVARELVELAGERTDCLAMAARLFASIGNSEDALETASVALALAQENDDQKIIEELKTLILEVQP